MDIVYLDEIKDITNIERVDIFKAAEKIKKVISSCKTKEHFDVAEKMIKNFHRVYEDILDEDSCTSSLNQQLSHQYIILGLTNI